MCLPHSLALSGKLPSNHHSSIAQPSHFDRSLPLSCNRACQTTRLSHTTVKCNKHVNPAKSLCSSAEPTQHCACKCGSQAKINCCASPSKQAHAWLLNKPMPGCQTSACWLPIRHFKMLHSQTALRRDAPARSHQSGQMLSDKMQCHVWWQKRRLLCCSCSDAL